MIPLDISVPLERLLWRDGQRLIASDLRNDLSYAERLRALHIRYLHRTWGVVEGLEVATNPFDPAVVNAGVALNREGYLLLLPKITAAPALPKLPVTATLYLVLSPESVCGCGCESSTPDLSTLCPGTTAAQARVQAMLAWKTVGEVMVGRDVLLARALVAAGAIKGAIDTTIQTRAATMRQQRIWSDTTVSGQTGWTDSDSKIVPGIQVNVDTSDAGFLTTPTYIAQVSGGASLAAQSISSADNSGFTLQLYFPASRLGVNVPNAAHAESSGWTVTWFAAE
jgi:hypothetical protein